MQGKNYCGNIAVCQPNDRPCCYPLLGLVPCVLLSYEEKVWWFSLVDRNGLGEHRIIPHGPVCVTCSQASPANNCSASVALLLLWVFSPQRKPALKRE